MSTFLDELRAEAAQVEANSTLELPVNGSRFAVRFRPPAEDDVDARARLTGVVAVYRQGGALSSDQERQLIVDCCDEVLRRTDSGELEPVDPDGGPLRFDGSDPRWGADVETAREAVGKLYKLDLRPMAASPVADRLVDWLQGLEDAALERVEGESGGGEDSSATPPASTSTD